MGFEKNPFENDNCRLTWEQTFRATEFCPDKIDV
jgi:hypothetical protein